MEAIGNRDTGSELDPNSEETAQILILLRWVLIIAIAYLVMFSRPLAQLPASAAAFIAFYLGSNLLLPHILRRAPESVRTEWWVVILDVTAVTLALYLANPGGNSDLFVLYFVVLFLSALSDGIGLAACAAVFISVAHLFTAASFVGMGELIQRGYMVRIPFLFAVAIFFGNLVQRARAREHARRRNFLRNRRMEFLSTISHDLRNPLGVIESLANLLLEADAGPLNPDQKNLVQRIHVSIRQVLNLSSNLIDAERIEADNFPLRKGVSDVRCAVRESLVLATTAAEIKGVSLEAELPSESCNAPVDTVQLERVLSNLLGNAIKFTPAGGEVRISLEARDRVLRVCVADSGPGVPERLLSQLGRRHLDDFLVTGSGTGLGLYIASAITAAHGGRLSAESSERGATFILELPAAVAPAEEAASQANTIVGDIESCVANGV